MDISQTLLNLNISIKGLSANTDSHNRVSVYLTFDVADASHLDSILKALKRVTGVENVYRTN